MSSLQDFATLDNELQKRLHFTTEDLATNMRGSLTPRQSEQLTQGRGCYRTFGCLFAAAGLLASLTMVAVSGAFFWFGRGWGAVVFGGFGLLLMLACVYIFLVAWRMQPPSALAVRRVEDEASVRIHPASDSLWKATVTIGGVSFRMTSYAARLFRSHVRFRVFYVQNGFIPILLSVETLN